jgi:hypothetical protein
MEALAETALGHLLLIMKALKWIRYFTDLPDGTRARCHTLPSDRAGAVRLHAASGAGGGGSA